MKITGMVTADIMIYIKDIDLYCKVFNTDLIRSQILVM